MPINRTNELEDIRNIILKYEENILNNFKNSEMITCGEDRNFKSSNIKTKTISKIIVIKYKK